MIAHTTTTWIYETGGNAEEPWFQKATLPEQYFSILKGDREPQPLVLPGYAKTAGAAVEMMIDDETELPFRVKKSKSC